MVDTVQILSTMGVYEMMSEGTAAENTQVLPKYVRRVRKLNDFCPQNVC